MMDSAKQKVRAITLIGVAATIIGLVHLFPGHALTSRDQIYGSAMISLGLIILVISGYRFIVGRRADKN